MLGAAGRARKLFLERTMFCIAFAAAQAGAGASASPWLRSGNEILLITRADYFTADLGEVSVNAEPVEARFQRIESNSYVEFGLTDKITLGGKVFYGTSWLARGAEIETASGFTELEAFAQYQVFRTGWRAGAVKVAGGVPTNFDSGVRPDLQNDGADVEISALYGQGIVFEPVKVFATAEVGYRRRFGDAADQTRLLTTVGVEPDERWTFLLDTFSVKSLENEAGDGADYDIVKIRPSVIWRATQRLAVQAGMSEEIAGRNVALGRTYFLGFWTRF